MRAHRVRFTRPRARTPQRCTKTIDGEMKFLHSSAGRSAKLDAMAEQRRRQGTSCARCNQYLELSEAKFESSTFRDGVENKLIHKRSCDANAN